MKTVTLAASLLICIVSLDAQVTATLKQLPDGSTQIGIKNDAAVNLVAYAISASVRSDAYSPVVVYSDPATTPLRPNEERAVRTILLWCGNPRDVITAIADWKSLRPGSPPPQDAWKDLCEFEQPITAGVFADGSTIGDAALLTRMLLRRGSMLLALDTTLETLSDAGRGNVPRDWWIEQFKKMADSLNRWYVLPEQKIGREVYLSMLEKLMELPEVALGSAFPPSSFIAQQSALLRQQRAALLESQPMLADAVHVR